jgi:hypothetical protein
MSAATAELMPITDDAARKKIVAGWKAKATEYSKSNKGEDPKNPAGDNLPDLQRRGEEAAKRAVETKEKAQVARDAAEHAHHQADRLDLAHLAAEVGPVLCSIALLTKKRAFWVLGIGSALVAITLTASAHRITYEGENSHESPAHSATEQGKPH